MSTQSTSQSQAQSQQTSRPKNYYGDGDQLTYDDAEVLVERYFRQDVERSVTRVKHVLAAFDKPYTNHNHRRVIEVLRERCKAHNPNRRGATRFEIPEEYL